MILPMGSTVPLTLYEDLRGSLPNLLAVGQGYAMSEAYTLLTLSFEVKYLGNVQQYTTLKIIDPENGQLCEPGEVGEVLVKCPGLMKGIYL